MRVDTALLQNHRGVYLKDGQLESGSLSDLIGSLLVLIKRIFTIFRWRCEFEIGQLAMFRAATAKHSAIPGATQCRVH